MNASVDFPAFFRQTGLRADGNSVVALALLALGALLLVARHPLRRELSEAFDFLVTRRLPLWITLLALGLDTWWAAEAVHDGGMTQAGDVIASVAAVPDAKVNVRPLLEVILAKWPAGADGAAMPPADGAWPAAGAPVLKSLTLEATLLLHEVIRPLPLAVLLPVWLVMATVGLGRYPYRYQREKLRAEQRTMLWVTSVLTMVWAGVYLFSFSKNPAARSEMAAVMQPATVLAAALAAAAFQVWLARSVIQWAEPAEEQMNARDETIARWQNVLWLGAFNAAWTALWLWVEGPAAGWWPWSCLAELLLVFAPLPVAVAMEQGRASLAQAGGAALKMLGRSWHRLVSWLVTALMLLAVAEAAIVMSAEWTAPQLANLGPVVQSVMRIIVRGFLHAWLVPAAMLAMWRGR